MKTKFKLIGLVTLLSIICTMTVLGAETSKEIYYNNCDINSTAIKQNGTYYIPLKEVAEQVHFKVTYDESTKTTKVYDNVDTATVNSKGELTSDGKVVDTKCAPIVKNGKTYVPLIFFSKGLGFGVSETNDKVKMYGKNMYKIVGDKNSSNRDMQVYSKNYAGEEPALIPVYYTETTGTDIRLSVYRTKNENDVIECYQYNGKNVYPTVNTYYNIGYLAMKYDHEGSKSYSSFYMKPEKIVPTQDDFNYYAKPLEDRVAVDGDKIAFVELLVDDTKNYINIYDDSKYGKEYAFKYLLYNTTNNEKFTSDHSPLDRVVRISSIKGNQLTCDVRTIKDVTGEVRKSVLTFKEDGTITETLEKSKNVITVMYNGKELELGKPGAIMIDGSVYMPLRVFSQELGYIVGWDSVSKTASVKNSTDEIYIDMKGNVKINGVESVTDKTPQIIENSTYVPLRFVSEAFGIKVDWDSVTRTVNMVQ